MMITNTKIQNNARKTGRTILLMSITSQRIRVCLILVVILFMTSCNIVRPCARSLCGCWKNTTIKYQTRIIDTNENPIEGVELLCPDTGEILGSSNVDGSVSIKFRTQISPGCGMRTCSELSVLQDQTHIGYVNLRLTKSNQGKLLIEEIPNQLYEIYKPNEE